MTIFHMNGWQTIDSAPKDGTLLLLYVPGGVERATWQIPEAIQRSPYCLGYWGANDEFLPSGEYWLALDMVVDVIDYGGMTGASESREQIQVHPSHWTHLPGHPEVGGGA